MIFIIKSSQKLLRLKFFGIFFVFILNFPNALALELWNSQEGIAKFNSSQYKNDFFQLANFYQAQQNPLFCSSASALIIKNALFYPEIPSQSSSETIKPDGSKIPFYLFISQEEFFNQKTETIKPKSVINFQEKSTKLSPNDYDPGLNLSDFAKILKIHKIKSKIYYQTEFNENEINKFRNVLKNILNDKNKFLIANFDGKILQAKTNGHISPIVAFDEISDSLLILDVALHKNQWYWVKLADFVKAMNTIDGNFFRGYLIVSR